MDLLVVAPHCPTPLQKVRFSAYTAATPLFTPTTHSPSYFQTHINPYHHHSSPKLKYFYLFGHHAKCYFAILVPETSHIIVRR